MPIALALSSAAPTIAVLGNDPDEYWFLEDVYQRILHGEIEDAYDAVELLEESIDEHLEDEAEFPEAAAFAFAEDPEAYTESLAEVLWSAAHEQALAWDDDTTDTDRFVAALGALEDRGIDAGIFTDFADVEAREGQRGAVVLWVNAWENFDTEAPIAVAISVAERGDATLADVVADAVVAFTEAGLAAKPGDDGTVEVTMQWRHHVASWEDAGGNEE